MPAPSASDVGGYYNLGGLLLLGHTINGARQGLIECGQHVHADAWLALPIMAGFEAAVDTQIEALMKSHALTAQVCCLCEQFCR
jgi:nitrilase